jgi:hypothetical protein
MSDQHLRPLAGTLARAEVEAFARLGDEGPGSGFAARL